MIDTSACPCDVIVHPRTVFNPPGRASIVYRVGDFTSFRHALLLSRDGETELAKWIPRASDDLAVQMVEWWAYLADILTFYNERIANGSYLQTALHASSAPETVNRVIRGIGYRPRPGIAAAGVVGALAGSSAVFTLPAGLQIQSKPGPGKQPQIFELDAAVRVTPIDTAAVEPAPIQEITDLDASGHVVLKPVLLKGAVTKAKPGDELLLLNKAWSGSHPHPARLYALVIVDSVRPEKDPHGVINTRVTFTARSARLSSLFRGAQARGHRLLKSVRTAHLWQFSAAQVMTANQVDLEAISRDIKVDDPILFEPRNPGPQTPGPRLATVTSYSEQIWYANAPGTNPAESPDIKRTVPIPIPHTTLGFAPSLFQNFDGLRKTLEVRYAWKDVGELLPTPVQALDSTHTNLTAAGSATFEPGDRRVLIEDANGVGVLASGHVDPSTPALMQVTYSAKPEPALKPPLRAIFTMLSISRGKTVQNEVLGSGDAGLPGQEFVLQNAPLTYLRAPELAIGYRGTLRIFVDQVEWKEADAFFGQSAKSRIFVTLQDDDGKTHVQFGDGINGARLPTGSNNVVARYRYGSGAEVPAPGALTAVLQPQPGLKAIVNPLPMTGGEDPDPPAQVIKYAVSSVLAFDRAVSLSDYETIAAQASGVVCARALWTWDADQRKMVVKVYVRDGDDAVRAARAALAGVVDPDRPLVVVAATAVPLQLKLHLKLEPTVDRARVVAAIRAALLHRWTGLFGEKAARPGRSLHHSHVHGAVMRIPGVETIVGISIQAGSESAAGPRTWHEPGEDRFFDLRAEDLEVSVHGR